jgi:hypothetical protein
MIDGDQLPETRRGSEVSMDDFVASLYAVFGDEVEEVADTHASPSPTRLTVKPKAPPQPETLDFEMSP